MKRLAARVRRAGARIRRQLGAAVFDNFFRGIATLGRIHPGLAPERFGIEVVRDVPYWNSGREDHLLDIYRPRGNTAHRPVVLYIHGGGFRILSKESHGGIGTHFARNGYVVANINYRLAPEHPYPAAAVDACRAYRWVVDNIAQFGGDPSRIVIAGESAGANLAAALAVANCYERPEPWAREVYELETRPSAVVPACGILQVSDAERFARRKDLVGVIADRLEEVQHAYLPDHDPGEDGLVLADPLLFFERRAPDRPLPPFYAFVGTKDPLLDDTRRLEDALADLDTTCEVSYLPGQPHAFHCMFWTPKARRVWNEKFTFLRRHLEAAT